MYTAVASCCGTLMAPSPEVRTAAARDHLLDVCADMEVLDMKSV
jgi:hypothetical protein